MTDDSFADEDDFELELEPVDPEIEEHQRRRAIQKTRAAEDSVDINALYSETHSGEPEDPVDFGEFKFKKFQFSIQHLLIITALLAVFMTVVELQNLFAAIAASIAASVAAGWWYVLRQERRQRAKKEVELAKFRANIAAQRAEQDGKYAPLPGLEETPEEELRQQPKFDFSFSLKEMFGAFTVAAVLLGLMNILGGPNSAAMLFGLIAISGLVLNAVGFDPPRAVVLSWWLLLVLYLFISVWAAVSNDQAALQRVFESGDVVTILGSFVK